MRTLKKSVSVITSTTGNVISDMLMAILRIISHLTGGAEDLITRLGDIVSGLGGDIKIVAHHTASGIGNLARTVAEGLGSVIERIPLAGRPTAYVVEKAGTGVHYVVLTVSDLVGAVGSTAGKGVKAGTRVIVFTLSEGNKLVGTALHESNQLVQSVLNRVNKLSNVNTNNSVTKKKKKLKMKN